MKDHYENRIVAFIDILGFANIIKSSTKNEILSIFQTLTRTRTRQFESHQAFGQVVSTFSDCIVISYPENSDGAFTALLSDLYNLQAELLMLGHTFRGAVTFGKLFHDDAHAFGSALVEAVYKEKKANFPRIIFSEESIAWGMKNKSDNPADGVILPHTAELTYAQYIKGHSIKRDVDELYYLDTFNIFNEFIREQTGKYNNFIEIVRDNIIKNLNILKEKNKKAYMKWYWTAREYNKNFEDFISLE